MSAVIYFNNKMEIKCNYLILSFSEGMDGHSYDEGAHKFSTESFKEYTELRRFSVFKIIESPSNIQSFSFNVRNLHFHIVSS